jgi:hypothetical protein
MFDKIIAWLEGKRTYLVAITGGILAICASLGVVVPEWVMALLASLGLATLRASVK